MSDDQSGAVLEAINDQLKAILEGQSAMAQVPSDIAEIKQDLLEVRSDLKVVKAAVTDQTHQLNDHETRLTTLEQAA